MKQFSLIDHGFEIHRNILGWDDVLDLRIEADRVAKDAGSACVRHIRSRSKRFDALSSNPLLLSLIPSAMRPVRSILFDKTETENWPVAWHQDLTIAIDESLPVPGYGPWSLKDGVHHVQPPEELLQTMITLRIHLDDATKCNGALELIPGSHRHGRIAPDVLREYDKSDATVCECKAGDILLMSPLVLHSSRRAVVPSRRRIIHYEYASEDALDDWLQWHESWPRVESTLKRK